MMTGTVTARREAIVTLRVRGPEGAVTICDAVIDTGFTSSLTLPTDTIVSLGLVRQSTGRASLADGSIRQFGYYAAEVEWCGVWRPVLISAIGDDVLLGMGLLAGSELRMTVVPGGVVEITPLL